MRNHHSLKFLVATALAGTAALSLAQPSGKEIYQGTCAACHGADGKGAVPGVPDMTSANTPLKNADAVMLKRLREGYQGPGSPMAMPASGGNPSLTDADLKAVLAYMHTTFHKVK